ncbi:MAG: hypothetical protein DRO04_01410, partial [Candidatus Iainarchaeum archaeon]
MGDFGGMWKATKRTLIILSIIMALLGASGFVYASQVYVIRVSYRIKPLSQASVNAEFSLGEILAGESGTKTHQNAITVTLNKQIWYDIHFKLDGNLTELQQVFDSLTIQIYDSGGVRAEISLTNPEAIYSMMGKQTNTFSIKIDYAVKADAEETTGTFNIQVWITP